MGAQRRPTHVYMHCIAKTLLTELHLAILVPFSRFSFHEPASGRRASRVARRRPLRTFHSQLPTFDSSSILFQLTARARYRYGDDDDIGILL